MSIRNFDPELVEYIVAEVIRRLRQQGASIANEPKAGNAELVLDNHVVTLATLDRQLTEVRRVVVNTRAIVTPAVKDELKEKGVELVRR
jgi:hypothetical protein